MIFDAKCVTVATMVSSFLSVQTGVLIAVICVGAALMIFIIVDTHRHKKKRHRERRK
jgi:hypothetical protein